MNKAPSLERELERRAGKSETAASFDASYQLMKKRLESQYYPWIQSKLPYYTDHGEAHIKAVTFTASHLIGEALLKNEKQFSDLDIFLTLSAIIWHDAGMVLGRSGHAKVVVHLMERIRELAFPTSGVFRLVNDIVKAHVGPNGLDIPDLEYSCTVSPNATYQVYPRALAAIVRFSDEISENQTRVSSAIMPVVPEPQQIYWQYAASIASSVADPGRRRIVVTFEFQADRVMRRFPCDDFPNVCDAAKRVSLLKYVLCRLEKMNAERAYCARMLARYSDIREVVVRMSLLQGVERVPGYGGLEFVIGDGGINSNSYPVIPFFTHFFERNPDWRPETLAKVIKL